ncbi:hypothetical protein BGP_3048 [Beggiatoa sp. PS]|nr:hypothetical protein BGP_3048 [Beggiatoa sp. PS]
METKSHSSATFKAPLFLVFPKSVTIRKTFDNVEYKFQRLYRGDFAKNNTETIFVLFQNVVVGIKRLLFQTD